MTLRAKVLLAFSFTVFAATGLLAWGVTRLVRRDFESLDQQRSDALAQQFRNELAQRGDEVASRVQSIADAESTLRMALDLSRPQADASLYAHDATGLAASHQLDFLELYSDDGSLFSSAQWPDRVGYKSDWLMPESDWNQQGWFLRRVDLADGADLGLIAVRTLHVGDKNLYIVGGRRLDRAFLSTQVLPAGMRALLYRNLEASFSPAALETVNGPADQPESFANLIDAARQQPDSTGGVIAWTSDPASAEKFSTVSFRGRQGEVLAVFLIGSPQRDFVQLLGDVRTLALAIAAGGLFLGLLVSWWISARVSRPIDRMTAAARSVTAGGPAVAFPVAHGEVGRLARAFRDMQRRQADECGRLVQSERVASWREMARRFVHELKEPLLSLQLSADGLQRARQESSERFDEIFFESITAVRAELDLLRATVGRFGIFAKMPAPRLQAVNVNETIRATLKAFEPQFNAVGRPPVTPELYLDERVGRVRGDPELIAQALEAVVLRSLDTMPAGGTLTVRTTQKNALVRVDISDTGAGLKPDECARMFTSYYAARDRGLGLATVQSIVSDHGGKISIESAPGAGSTYRLEFPVAATTAIPALPRLVAAPSLVGTPSPSAPPPAPPPVDAAPEPVAAPPDRPAEAEAAVQAAAETHADS